MILKGKNAIIYGAGGSMGSAIAKAFSDAGASLLLTGRNQASLHVIAEEIMLKGGFRQIKHQACNLEEIQ